MTTLRPFILSVFLLASASLAAWGQENPSRIDLKSGWELQTSAQVKQSGEVISTPSFRPDQWKAVGVPTTVVATMVGKDKPYPDPFFDMNLRQLPGMTYPVGNNFSNIEMAADSPFAVPWWYRTEFTLPDNAAGKRVALHFDGVNYRANVWLNGKLIANQNQLVGMWRQFEFDVTDEVKAKQPNVLAVQVFAPKKDDLAITFVDWNPLPPDKNMGIWRPVFLTIGGDVSVRHPFVDTKLDGKAARLTVSADVTNQGKDPVKGNLIATIDNIALTQSVELQPGESREVILRPEDHPDLVINDPRLWWPAQMGSPELYDLELRFEIKGQVSDSAKLRFGVREVAGEMDAEKKRLLFKINGKPILIRGGGWASDMMLRHDPQRMEREFRYTMDMGLNTIRLEGKLETDDFFEMADRLGVLIMPGWCCCDHWEHWKDWKTEDQKVSEYSQRDQILRMRKHPSVFVWLNASDMPPTPEVERTYIRVLKELRWPNPYVSSATATPSLVTGPTGVKMNGPYEWVPPVYWLEDRKHGGAWSFATEISPGPSVPNIESLRKMLPADKLWPVNDHWTFHAGGNEFKNIEVYTKALNARYGAATSAEDFARKSQLMNYEGIRAMFDGYSRNKYDSTGVIQWMLNDAWPKIIWNLYDYYLQPHGGYFGAKKANAPLNPMYSYNDGTVWVVNSQYRDVKGLKLTATVLDLNMKERFTKQATFDAKPDSSTQLLSIPPQLEGLSATYFVSLTLDDSTGRRVGSNLYWLSTQPDKLAWETTKWWYTPVSTYADFTALSTLPKVRLKSSARTTRNEGQMQTTVSLHNPSKHLAFFIRLKLNDQNGNELLPVVWEDNYISLRPGEKRTLTATHWAQDIGDTKPVLAVEGWNVQK